MESKKDKVISMYHKINHGSISKSEVAVMLDMSEESVRVCMSKHRRFLLVKNELMSYHYKYANNNEGMLWLSRKYGIPVSDIRKLYNDATRALIESGYNTKSELVETEFLIKDWSSMTDIQKNKYL